MSQFVNTKNQKDKKNIFNIQNFVLKQNRIYEEKEKKIKSGGGNARHKRKKEKVDSKERGVKKISKQVYIQ